MARITTPFDASSNINLMRYLTLEIRMTGLTSSAVSRPTHSTRPLLNVSGTSRRN